MATETYSIIARDGGYLVKTYNDIALGWVKGSVNAYGREIQIEIDEKDRDTLLEYEEVRYVFGKPKYSRFRKIEKSQVLSEWDVFAARQEKARTASLSEIERHNAAVEKCASLSEIERHNAAVEKCASKNSYARKVGETIKAGNRINPKDKFQKLSNKTRLQIVSAVYKSIQAQSR